MKVKLLKPYVRDLEWWVAYPIDPDIGSRWAHHDPGEVLDVSVEEAHELIGAGTAEIVGSDG